MQQAKARDEVTAATPAIGYHGDEIDIADALSVRAERKRAGWAHAVIPPGSSQSAARR